LIRFTSSAPQTFTLVQIRCVHIAIIIAITIAIQVPVNIAIAIAVATLVNAVFAQFGVIVK
jgi:hypothetical protein